MRLGDYTMGFVLGAIMAFGVAEATFAPTQAIVREDLNQDGIYDLVIEEADGTKVPMYGIREGKRMMYFSASEMMKRDPNSVINYKTIESKLNE